MKTSKKTKSTKSGFALKKKAAALSPAQKAWVTIRANRAAAEAAKVKLNKLNKLQINPGYTPVFKTKVVTGKIETAPPAVLPKKSVKSVKGLVLDQPPTVAQITGQYEVAAKPILAPAAAPKPKTLQELFTSEDKWTKGADGRDKVGNGTSYNDLSAVKHCLGGAASLIGGGSGTDARSEIIKKLKPVITAYSLGTFGDVVSFNDATSTTFKDIQRVIRLANV